MMAGSYSVRRETAESKAWSASAANNPFNRYCVSLYFQLVGTLCWSWTWWSSWSCYQVTSWSCFPYWWCSTWTNNHEPWTSTKAIMITMITNNDPGNQSWKSGCRSISPRLSPADPRVPPISPHRLFSSSILALVTLTLRLIFFM